MNCDINISVIVPVHNNNKGLDRCLLALSRQTINSSEFEVIIVDNDSADDPVNITKKYDVKLLREYQYLNSPYSARNRGFEIAKGDILIMLDTTCAPCPTWLEEGVKCINSGADLVGGNVVFDVSDKSSLGELYDSITNIRMKDSVINRNVAKTTNLFVKRDVIDSIGNFPEGLRSGGDVSWTKNATSSGYSLVYSDLTKVSMTPRPLIPLIYKQFRVSKGQVDIWINHGGFFKSFSTKALLCFIPPNPYKLRQLSIEANNDFALKRLAGLFWVGYLLRIVTGLGVFFGVFGMLYKKIKG
ncbi:glycosyltransferase [Amphritea sp. HPY]|uniref:glycosyltransferase n=1 Tax=Amphritea sp. HPY TaxID=3421652 RepID=UPI003D7CCF0A